MTEKILTQDWLRSLLDYDPETGVFINKVTRNPRAKIGRPAGTLNSEGYTVFQINGKKIFAHRAVWLYVHGAWPQDEIDHINRNRNDNRLCNLRAVDRCANAVNTGAFVNNTSGHKGVTWSARRKKWQVQMQVRRKTFYVGQYDLLADAVQARVIAEIFLHQAA